jgi:outer membrane protein assembly complex protein YaeT
MRRLSCCVCFALLGLLVSGCKEEGTVVVKSIKFNGVNAVDASRLRNALATRQSAKLPWGRKYYFDRSRFDADLKRVEAFYADRGYPNARVTGFDVQLNDKQDAVEITVTVDEGDPVTVADVELIGFEVIPQDHLQTMRNRLPLKVGQPRDRQNVVVAHEMAINELRDHGFPYAKVNTAERGDKETVVTFTAEPGTLAHFGPVEIVGNRSVSNRVIERQLTFKAGDLYRRSVVQDSQRRLYAMELFQFVNIEPVEPEKQEPDVRTRITLAEGKHQRVNLGVGYGTEEKARIDTSYHHVNFLGGARTAGIRGRYSTLDRGLRLEFNQPYLFTPHFSLGAEGQRWRTFTPAYESDLTGAKVTLTHRSSRYTSWSTSFINERNDSTISQSVRDDPELFARLRNDLIALGLDPETGSQDGTLNAFAFDFQRSTADNLLNARRGYQIAGHVELAPEYFPGQYHYNAFTADARHYLPFGERLSLASRVQIGSIDALNEEPGNVPFAKKFFLGGSSSIRGWGRYEVSPLGTSGLPIGGNSLFAFTSELRAVVRGSLGGVLFLDGGNVWTDEWHVDPSELKYAVGVGLRYQTAVGPIRFDFGHQLNPVDGLVVNGTPEVRHWRIHFSIGQAF